MCCLMITTVWNVVMLRSNLIHHGGRWTRMISTTMIFSKCLFYCDTCTYGWICGTCISETVLMTMYIPELHDYLSPLPFSLLARLQGTVSLSLSSKYPSIFLSVSVKSLSLSLSPLFSDCTQIWLAFLCFVNISLQRLIHFQTKIWMSQWNANCYYHLCVKIKMANNFSFVCVHN